MASDVPTDPPKLALRTRGTERNRADGPSTAPDPNGATAHLETNLTAHREIDLAPSTRPDTPRPRARNYAVRLLVGNFVMVGLFLIFPKNVVTAVFALSGIVLFSIGLTWTVWVVDKK
ncbi:MAG: hypothetical protein JNN01_11570 [Opitutaceae bacterium]|nr:hypothetical protein [Opitutaceae bacterium]